MMTSAPNARAASALVLLLTFASVQQHAEAITIWDWMARLTKYSNPYAYAGRPQWLPKNDGGYRPERVSWKSVVSACKCAVNYEKRLGNFFIRAAFHDSMAINLTACLTGNTVACGGADSSLFLSTEEMTRTENAYDDFSAIAAKAVKKIATYYNSSVADTLAVCGAAAVEVLSGGRVQIIGRFGLKNLRVGRLDSSTPSPPGTLPPASFSLDEFASWFTARGFTIDEAVALLGSHSLIDEQACFKGPTPFDYCDPANQACQPRMFSWSNHYYHDACTPALTIQPEAPHTFNDTPIVEMTDTEFAAAVRREKCKFSSPEFRLLANAEMEMIRAKVPGHVELPDFKPDNVTWSNRKCQDGAMWGAKSCPHSSKWFYTLNDAFLAKACQTTSGLSWNAQLVQSSMRRFLYQPSWDDAFANAYIKMVTKFGKFAPLPLFALPFEINGKECPAGYAIDQVCKQTRYGGFILGTDYTNCWGCDSGVWCHECCKCQDAFGMGCFSFKPSVPTVFPPPPPPAPPIDITAVTVAPAPALPAPEIPINPGGAAWTGIPPSPYGLPAGACSGTKTTIQGFPSSSFPLNVFGNAFQNPPIATKVSTTCLNPTTCMDAYRIEVTEVTKNLNAGCTLKPTTLLSYGGSVPGPTIVAPVGNQTLVRFVNKISTLSTTFTSHPPCNGARSGRPISIHHHGSASLAPFDGWAQDTICNGESKDYIYPVNRAGTGWYHDHQLEITAENAHAGLAGFFLAKYDSISLKTVKDRWGLDNMTEYNLMLADKVMDSNCQLVLDTAGVHKNDHFGDINLVSGIPFPVLATDPKWVRFRLVNAAVSRPYLLQIVNNAGAKIGPTACKVIAGDGGYRRAPVAFPTNGLFMTIAERYEFVCDFRAYAGQTLYLWNHKDEARMKGVPFFCYSHLVMKIVVNTNCLTCTATTPVFNPTVEPATANSLDPVISPTEYSTALAQAQAGVCHRSFKFGRGNGQWVINGETWHSMRVAAQTEQSSMEIWCLETPGGWYHSIHIHLVDFYVLKRQAAGQYQVEELYEKEVPKDVVALHAGGKLSLLVRWGPHRGEYMFHCHLLRHEDSEMLRSFSTNTTMVATTATNAQNNRFGTIGRLAFQGAHGRMYDNYTVPGYTGAAAKSDLFASALDATYVGKRLNEHIYRIFYPMVTPAIEDASTLCNSTMNPWRVRNCPV